MSDFKHLASDPCVGIPGTGFLALHSWFAFLVWNLFACMRACLGLVFLKLRSWFEAFDVELLGCDSKFDIKVWMHVCSNPYDVI